jgi:hypothetical protein
LGVLFAGAAAAVPVGKEVLGEKTKNAKIISRKITPNAIPLSAGRGVLFGHFRCVFGDLSASQKNTVDNVLLLC